MTDEELFPAFVEKLSKKYSDVEVVQEPYKMGRRTRARLLIRGEHYRAWTTQTRWNDPSSVIWRIEKAHHRTKNECEAAVISNRLNRRKTEESRKNLDDVFYTGTGSLHSTRTPDIVHQEAVRFEDGSSMYYFTFLKRWLFFGSGMTKTLYTFEDD